MYARIPKMFKPHGTVSSVSCSKAMENMEFYASDEWASAATTRLLPYASSMANHTGFGQYWTLMWSGLESAWSGQRSAGDAVADIVAEAQNTLGDEIIIR